MKERWAAGQFVSMVERHMKMKQQQPDGKPSYGNPYEGIENLRPETREMLGGLPVGAVIARRLEVLEGRSLR